MTVVEARRILVEGVVQGVGFRPFVHALATRGGLAGWVRNTSSGVEIEIEGAADALDVFVADLVAETPPLAHIDRVRKEILAPTGHRAFEILESRNGDGFQPLSPDVATCDECRREVTDPRDRRFGYAFTNCTRCGPRFTIIRAIPYDRPNTTMAGFTMCKACQVEYDDPGNRRFHAQPNACPDCGPRLSLVDAEGRTYAGDPLVGTRRLLAGGSIVAIKGIGGFHLACDATSEVSVLRLRERKGREAKPLALMVANLAEAERICVVSVKERTLLTSPGRPIVLLRERPGSGIAPSVAPGLGWLGVLLPYTPLHHLLFGSEREQLPPLVMTSGNLSDEPIVHDNDQALARLHGIADFFLLHDRPIHVRCDDSVTRIAVDREQPIRRSRGYAPFPVRLPFEARQILACGAELKNTFCLTRGPYAFVSPHIGDLNELETYAAYGQMVERLEDVFRIRPEAIAHDLHPDYLSTRFAERLEAGIERVAVQHHHAHVAACMAEHQLVGPVIGVAFDGTGYGSDGTIWGGEFLVADYARFTRVGHLRRVPMPGGDRAAREPFRMALAHLLVACGEWDADLPPVRDAAEAEQRAIAWQIEHGINAPLTSSAGRLFDAVAALVGVRQRARYEAQAAMELEALVDPTAHGEYPVIIGDGAPAVIDTRPVIRGVVADLLAGVARPVIAARFHWTMAAMVSKMCERIRQATGLNRVALSGGVFQNLTLLGAAYRRLAEDGFEVFSHELVPANDGGIALGQAAVAHAVLERII